MRLSRDARNYLLFGTMLFVVLEALLAVAIIWWPSSTWKSIFASSKTWRS